MVDKSSEKPEPVHNEKQDHQSPDSSPTDSSLEHGRALDRIREVSAQVLTHAQVGASFAGHCGEDPTFDVALKQGSACLVDQFAARDAVEANLAPVIVGLRNAIMTSLQLAAKNVEEQRAAELHLAFKGMGVLAQLTERFDAHRGCGSRSVMVGNVNVERGAQAIVGNVEGPRRTAQSGRRQARQTASKPVRRVRLAT